jgi:L-threonylcarbamoyladenylate synthase
VLEGGPTEVGIESTIVDLSGAAPVLLRPGRISRRTCESVSRLTRSEKARASPRHSGGLERHYAPRTPARLVPATTSTRRSRASGKGRGARLLAARRARRLLAAHAARSACLRRKLYAALRELDTAGCDEILIEAPPEAPEWTRSATA